MYLRFTKSIFSCSFILFLTQTVFATPRPIANPGLVLLREMYLYDHNFQCERNHQILTDTFGTACMLPSQNGVLPSQPALQLRFNQRIVLNHNLETNLEMPMPHYNTGGSISIQEVVQARTSGILCFGFWDGQQQAPLSPLAIVPTFAAFMAPEVMCYFAFPSDSARELHEIPAGTSFMIAGISRASNASVLSSSIVRRTVAFAGYMQLPTGNYLNGAVLSCITMNSTPLTLKDLYLSISHHEGALEMMVE